MFAACRFSSALLVLALGLSAGPTLALNSYSLESSSASKILDEHSSYAKVRTGQSVEIRLNAQGGTGYSWQPSNYQDKIKALSTKAGGMPGGKEMQRFRFKSSKKGTYVVNFSYGQPWKGGAKNAKRRSFTIKVS